VRCAPHHRRRGLGAGLYAEATRDLERLGAREIRATAREAAPWLVAALTRLGFVELFRSLDFELDLAAHAAHDGALAPAAPHQRIEITPLTEERARHPDWLPALHALYVSVNREVPLPNHIDPALDAAVFADYLERAPTSLPEACFIAKEGERYVGLCILHANEDDPTCLQHLFTGVDAACRGRGVARELKLATIAFARRRGYARIVTAVESNNPSMLALNESLGFVRRSGLVVLERRRDDRRA
jgi:ribosomal protein S18 acetylase RimI-like enzyme